jgi:hypothetical protein
MVLLLVFGGPTKLTLLEMLVVPKDQLFYGAIW